MIRLMAITSLLARRSAASETAVTVALVEPPRDSVALSVEALSEPVDRELFPIFMVCHFVENLISRHLFIEKLANINAESQMLERVRRITQVLEVFLDELAYNTGWCLHQDAILYLRDLSLRHLEEFGGHPSTLLSDESPYPRIKFGGVRLDLGEIALWGLGSDDALVLLEDEVLVQAADAEDIELVDLHHAVEDFLGLLGHGPGVRLVDIGQIVIEIVAVSQGSGLHLKVLLINYFA